MLKPLTLAFALLTTAASAQTVVEAWPADAAPGASIENIIGNTFQGEIMGATDYVYQAPGIAGKTLSVNLIPMGEVAFDIRGSDPAADPLFDSTASGPDAAIVLPADDTYNIRVYQTGEGATTDAFATFMITLGLY